LLPVDAGVGDITAAGRVGGGGLVRGGRILVGTVVGELEIATGEGVAERRNGVSVAVGMAEC
jgi:hypothetical protein